MGMEMWDFSMMEEAQLQIETLRAGYSIPTISLFLHFTVR
jgi:hypothetical protein